MRKQKVQADIKVTSVTLTQLYVSLPLFILQRRQSCQLEKCRRLEAPLLPPTSA